MKFSRRDIVCMTIVLLSVIVTTSCVPQDNPIYSQPEVGSSTVPVTVDTPNSIGSVTPSPDRTTMFQQSVGEWSLRMTKADLEKSLRDSGISFTQEKDEAGQVWFDTDNISFGMTQNNVVITLNVSSPTYETSLGVRIGDSASKVEELYGDGYDHDDYLLNYCHAWEYSNNDIYVRFIFDNDQNVSTWEIATYSLLDL